MKNKGIAKINYPVKYAVMPIYSEVDIDYSKILAYVPAKCYLIKKTEEFLQNGTKKLTYDVVFTWNYTEKTENIKPSYMFDLMENKNHYFNTTEVDKVYDELLDARIKANEANEDMLIEQVACCTDADEIAELEEQYNNLFTELNEIANKHLEQE